MTEEERKRVKAGYVALSAYYQKPLEDYVLRLYCEDLEDMAFELVVQAMNLWRKNPKSRSVPLPAELRAITAPVPLTDEQIAQDAVSRLIYSVGRFGHTNPDRAKKHMGELAWMIVERDGGWPTVCRMEHSQMGIARAQWLKLALSLIAQSKNGTLSSAPALPGPQQMSLQNSMQPVMLVDILKRLEEK